MKPPIPLIILSLLSACAPPAARYPEITIWESDRMLEQLPVDPDSLFHTRFPAHTWAFDLMAERDHLYPAQIFWIAIARAHAVSGSADAIVEYSREDTTALAATAALLETMQQSTDTIHISPF